jgi:Cu/Ag efflux protein CusF
MGEGLTGRRTSQSPSEPASCLGTNLAAAAYPPRFKKQETAMKIAKIILAGTGALILVASAASAQQMLTGTITKVDRINSSLAIRQTQSGTVGANSGGAAEEFKTQDGLSLEKLHAGDRVTFSATEKGGVKTITKIQPQ